MTLTTNQLTFISNAVALVTSTQTTIDGIITLQWNTVSDLKSKTAYLLSNYNSSDPLCDLSNEINSIASMIFIIQGALDILVTATNNIVNIVTNDPTLSTSGDAAVLELSGQQLECVQSALKSLGSTYQNTVNTLQNKSANLQHFYNTTDPNCNLLTESQSLQNTALSIQQQMSSQIFVPTMLSIIETLAGTD